ncbi:uncharacterized protein LOC130711537 [Lotus japonicus]|uniref:uncharacterized protein LOC130711537 n=1 Tax=Lotus japonicus TaxID=34305 RepID=UPI002582C449|nr:uncharacterized protein LOC130711537 [Lotus japonicus]
MLSFFCREVAPIWFASHLSLDFRQRPHDFTVFNWVAQVLKQMDEWVSDSVLTLLFALWERRNMWCFEGRWYPYDMVLARATSLDMVEVAVVGGGTHGPARRRGMAESAHRVWKPPDPGKIKVNVDAAFPVGSLMGFGFIARNSRGQVLATAAARWPRASSVAVVEGMALHWALQLSLDLGFFEVVVEIDNQLVVKAWKSYGRQCSYLASVVSDCFNISSAFHSFNLSHVLRSSNMEADYLANFALTNYCFVGLEEYPWFSRYSFLRFGNS